MPLDLGGSGVTGMHVSTVYRLRQALGLDAAGHAGQGDRALPDAGRDRARPGRRRWASTCVGLGGRGTMFGFRQRGLEAVDALRRHARAGAGRLQHRPGAERRHLHVPARATAPSRPAAACRPAASTSTRSSARSRSTRRRLRRRGQPGGVRPDLATPTWRTSRPRRERLDRHRHGRSRQLRRHRLRRHRAGARPAG